MHGDGGREHRNHGRHMCSVATSTLEASPAGPTSVAAISSDSFSKDGRKIYIGDCALFKPPQDSPAFIGIIRRLISTEEKNLGLSVNWLYRPADVKLGKGASVEAAPNEVFYSFHKDEILAASLLHPCKVAFLRKGVELPSGISSFVCRRVYDVENKCLWWLTDQDYINARQEEVNQLLQKTRIDMYGAVQSGEQSPKELNGTTGNQQLRTSSESAQNISSHIPSQIKIKKKERVDHGSDPVKRECLSRADDTDFDEFRGDQVLKSEIAKIAHSGGLVDYEGVEKLVQLMQPDSVEKKINLACRMMLVDVIAVTDNFDCLGWFVQLRGLPVLDRWLQEVHKGKIGDGSSPKESDKFVEDFLLVLLRALDKLPVNLHALQTCNVGKSVNCLRTHKNIDIQRKARTLVDTWKKRVEAEMNVLDTKSGSSRGSPWPSKSTEVSPMGNRRSGVQSEANNGKSSSAQSSGKASCVKIGSGESVSKVVVTSPNSSKSIASTLKDPISAVVTGSDPLSTIKEEKSSSSGHSRNNSQSCSSDHAKTVGSFAREDAPSSTAGSISGTKISVSGSRHRKSSHNLQVSALPGVQKETSFGKLSLNKSVGSDKVLPSGGTHEKIGDAAVPEHGNSQRLIVRLPNTGRSPARSSTGGPSEDPIALSKNSPSARSAKRDNFDRKVKEKSDVMRLDTVSKGEVEYQNVLIRSDEGNLSHAMAISNGQKQCADDGDKVIEAHKRTVILSECKFREGNLYDASFKSMNALVESCVKFSEASATASGGENIGMNLLASVAAGEMSRSDGSLTVSRGRNLPVPEESFSGNDVNSRHIEEDTARSEDQIVGNGGATHVQSKPVNLRAKNEPLHDAKHTLADLSEDIKASVDTSTGISSANVITKDDVKKVEAVEFHDQRTTGEDMNANCTNIENTRDNVIKLPEVALSSKTPMKETQEEKSSLLSTDMHQEDKSAVLCKVPSHGILNEEKLPVAVKAIVGNSEACAFPPNSVGFTRRETEKEKDTDTIKPNEKQKDNIPLTISDQSKEHVEKPDKKALGGSGKSSSEEPGTVILHQTDKLIKLNGCDTVGPVVSVKLDFDLNEGFDVDDGYEVQIVKSPVRQNKSSAQLPCPSSLPMSSMTGSFPASVTVASAAKGPFYPPENSFRGKGEFGWKGSAATSAFRPAEPRKTPDITTGSPSVDAPASKEGRTFLDFDLNVADERDLEDETRSGGLDLDLNRVDESQEVRKLLLNKNPKMGVSQLCNIPALSDRFPNDELSSSRNFDLNSGPGPDDVPSETSIRAKSNVPYLSPLPGVRMSSSDQASLSSWFPQGNSYPPIAITPILPNRGEHGYPIVSASGSQRIMGHPAGITSFGPEFYRGPVLSSSPALSFPNNVPFQYPFPFETNFPMPSHSYQNTSTAYPSIPSQLVGPSGVVSSHYPRAYMMNIPGGATNTGADSRTWVGQALDLNNGPGSAELERRDERLSSASRQAPISGSQAFSADEHLRMYQMAGVTFKRKEPDGGWDGDKTNFKQRPPWQ